MHGGCDTCTGADFDKEQVASGLHLLCSDSVVAIPPFLFFLKKKSCFAFFKVRARISIKISVSTYAMHGKVTQFKGKKVYLTKILDQFKYVTIICIYFI